MRWLIGAAIWTIGFIWILAALGHYLEGWLVTPGVLSATTFGIAGLVWLLIEWFKSQD